MKDIPFSELHTPTDIRRYLPELRDEPYRTFQCRLIPTVETERVIGIRAPILRSLSRKLHGTSLEKLFLSDLPHFYYEENNLHGFLLSLETDVNRCFDALRAFLPFVDNWATCDGITPVCFANHHELLLPEICHWIHSDSSYTVRFGIGMLMRHFLDTNFREEYLYEVAELPTESYYVHMMVAWYFATALAKQYDATLPILQKCRIDSRTHNKIIQKAIESYRISQAQKEYLRTLRR